MEIDQPPTTWTRSSYFAGCMAFPSCLFPAHRDPCRFHHLRCGSPERGRRWRSVVRRLLKEGKSVYCSPKPLNFGYDAVSYSKNFDDGRLNEEGTIRYNLEDAAGLWSARACESLFHV